MYVCTPLYNLVFSKAISKFTLKRFKKFSLGNNAFKEIPFTHEAGLFLGNFTNFLSTHIKLYQIIS